MSTKFDSRGREICDPTPIEVPAGFHHPPSLEDRMKRYIRDELSATANNEGFETFEEADDFDIPDDPIDPTTPYETVFDPGLGKEITNAEKNMLDRDRKAFDDYVTVEKKRKSEFDEFYKRAGATPAAAKKTKAPKKPQNDEPEEE